VLARILLAQEQPGQALALLDRLHAAAAAQDRTGSLVEIGALRALALTASGDEAGAVTTLAEALLLACPQGQIRVFADEGPPMAGQVATAGQVTPWCPVLPGRFHPACPLSGDAWPAGSS
jgi:LuxR family maltose regulon positive regulatory protein